MRTPTEQGRDRIVTEQRPYIRAVGSLTLSECARNDSGLDDFESEVVARIYSNIDALRDPNRIHEWVRGVARMTAREWNRRAAIRRQTEASEDEIGPENEPWVPAAQEESLIRRENYREICAAFSLISPTDQELFYRHYYMEESFKAAAKHLGFENVRTARSRASRARKRLKEILSESGAPRLRDALKQTEKVDQVQQNFEKWSSEPLNNENDAPTRSARGRNR